MKSTSPWYVFNVVGLCQERKFTANLLFYRCPLFQYHLEVSPTKLSFVDICEFFNSHFPDRKEEGRDDRTDDNACKSERGQTSQR